LQVDNKDISYVTELKYLGVHVCAGQLLTFSVGLEHLRSKFCRTFNCIYSRSNTSNFEMISVELLKSYCFPFFAVDAMSMLSTNIRILENCINRALFRIFGSCDKSSLDYIKICTGPDNIKGLLEKRHCSFIDKLISLMCVLLIYF